jgi:hypothetical protein
MAPDLFTRRIALLCLLGTAILMVLYYLCPYFFIGPLGIILLLPGALIVAVYLAKLFRPR